MTDPPVGRCLKGNVGCLIQLEKLKETRAKLFGSLSSVPEQRPLVVCVYPRLTSQIKVDDGQTLPPQIYLTFYR